MAKPTCTIIAGPNGAGKTTFALQYLPDVAGHRRFVNADLIAAGLPPLAPEAELRQASRLFLSEVEAHIRSREDFAFETTLAGRGYLRLIKRLKKGGWRIVLVYLALWDVAVSEQRVAERVRYGGHDIPTSDIHRRFSRSLANLLDHYTPASAIWCSATTIRAMSLFWYSSRPAAHRIYSTHTDSSICVWKQTNDTRKQTAITGSAEIS